MLYKIIITAVAGELDTEVKFPNLEEVCAEATAAAEVGSEFFSEYFDDDIPEEVSGGEMSFFVKDGKIHVKTIYESERVLTKEEEKNLIDYTQGQWSDGIGEGFEQEPLYVDNKEYYLSPYYHDQVATLHYEVVYK